MVTGTPAQTVSGRRWRGLRWLILAPHPDDETLGAGALIAQTARSGSLAGVVYVTDGSGSHTTQRGPWGRLVNVRRREAATALHRLTGRRDHTPVHLGWADAKPARPTERQFDRSCRALVALCHRWRVDGIAVTALHEPHCDHAAAALLAYAAQASAKRRMMVAEYVVWADAPDRRTHRAIATAPMLQGARRHALRAHRSQLTASHGDGFRLPRIRQRMSARDVLYVRRKP